MKVFLYIQTCFPLKKNGGGVAKRYLTLIKTLIEKYNYNIYLVTSMDVYKTEDRNILEYLDNGKLKVDFINAYLIKLYEAKAVFNYISFQSMYYFTKGVKFADLCFIDDTPFSNFLVNYAGIFGKPCVVSHHTDISHFKIYKYNSICKYLYKYFLFFYTPVILASTSRIFGKKTNIKNIWPPLIWSEDFKKKLNPERLIEKKNSILKEFLPFKPKKILLFVGRISYEKRIHLLIESLPDNMGLIIVGSSDSEYLSFIKDKIGDCKNIIFISRMCSSNELLEYYSISDMFISASNFETLGNTLIESWCCGTPVGVQPEQGHLEYLEDNLNGFEINFSDPEEAKNKLIKIFGENRKLEKLKSTQLYFRNLDFGCEIHNNLIIPALNLEISRIKNFIILFLSLPILLILFMIYFICIIVFMDSIKIYKYVEK